MKKDLIQIVTEMYNPNYMVVYHVSPTTNRASILSKGLIINIGKNSENFGENTEGIYLFPTMDDLENALENWLGELYEDDDEELDIYKITLPENFPLEMDVDYEFRSLVNIQPQHIQFLTQI